MQIICVYIYTCICIMSNILPITCACLHFSAHRHRRTCSIENMHILIIHLLLIYYRDGISHVSHTCMHASMHVYRSSDRHTHTHFLRVFLASCRCFQQNEKWAFITIGPGLDPTSDLLVRCYAQIAWEPPNLGILPTLAILHQNSASFQETQV